MEEPVTDLTEIQSAKPRMWAIPQHEALWFFNKQSKVNERQKENRELFSLKETPKDTQLNTPRGPVSTSLAQANCQNYSRTTGEEDKQDYRSCI